MSSLITIRSVLRGSFRCLHISTICRFWVAMGLQLQAAMSVQPATAPAVVHLPINGIGTAYACHVANAYIIGSACIEGGIYYSPAIATRLTRNRVFRLAICSKASPYSRCTSRQGCRTRVAYITGSNAVLPRLHGGKAIPCFGCWCGDDGGQWWIIDGKETRRANGAVAKFNFGKVSKIGKFVHQLIAVVNLAIAYGDWYAVAVLVGYRKAKAACLSYTQILRIGIATGKYVTCYILELLIGFVFGVIVGYHLDTYCNFRYRGHCA